MTKCICGHEMQQKLEPCFFEENCTGCALCNDGMISIVWCENEDCKLKEFLEKEDELELEEDE